MTVGIDFGTSTSEIAYIGKDGKLNIVPNHLGEQITPSAVYIESDGSDVVGREAKGMVAIEPENTFLEVKRLFGQSAKLKARGKAYTPVGIAAKIIKYLVGCAEKHAGEAIDSAVITVPAYFTDSQRKDVIAAGKEAGLNVERIINEPTAASLDYGISHIRDCNHILVYDFGGGTLDVTVLELFEGVVEVKSSCGNSALGGKDFDQDLIDHISGVIKKQDGIDLSGDARAMMRIKVAAEQCKIALSTDKAHMLELPFLFSKGGEPAGYIERITRVDFEDMAHGKIYSTEKQIKTALADAGLEKGDIGLALLVGGSTRIPLVKQFLFETFGFKPKAAVDPDLAVVRGAAIQAGVLSGALDKDAIVLTDVCPHSLSTCVVKEGPLGYDSLICDILIKRNATLPASVSNVYVTAHDNQTQVRVDAYQGESEDPAENYLLNTFLLGGIPKAREGKEKINIQFEYDLNGILKVRAEIMSTGKQASVAVDTAAVGKNLELSKWKESRFASRYRQIIGKADRLAKVHGSKAKRVESAATELKKALALGWDEEIVSTLAIKLTFEVMRLENND